MGNSFGSALGSGAGNAVSELVVQAPRLIGSSVGSAVGQGVGQALGQGIGGAIGGSSAPTGQGYTSQDPANTYDGGDYTNVEGVDVVAPSSQATANIAPSAPLSMPSFGDVVPYSAPTLVSQLAGSNLPPSNIAGLDVVAPSLPTITQPDSVLSRMAPLTGLTSQMNGAPTGDDVYGSQPGGMDERGILAALGLTGGAASLIKGGLNLLPAGLLAAQIIGGQQDSNEAGTVNQQQQQDTLGQLGQLAGQNSGLSKFLGDKAMANLGGNIGGPAMSAIQRAVRASQARIRSRYHQMGMSGSTAEGQDLQAAELQGVETQFKVAQDMATQGLASVAQLTGQSMNAYTQILNAQMMQGTALGNAAASFAASSTGALGEIGKMMDKYL